ncbi:MAG: M48 family metallopeptidase [Acidobacteriota bacterium]|nr:M48 family metallopeptidase [Acidobacteriota bacterium]
MRKEKIRKFTAFLLFSAIWLSATALPASVFAQTDTQQAQNKQQDDNKKKKEKKQKDSNKQNPTAQQQSTNNPKAPLTVNEDPTMIGKRNINKGSDSFFGWLGGSQEKELALGRQLAMQVEQQAKIVEDPVITEYVNRVGQNIVLHSDAKIPFTIKVIQGDEVNAFALPGGYFYVYTGLILAADNEAELAGVMAHEIAHVAARHAMENSGKGTLLNYGILAGIIFGGGIASTILQNVGGIGSSLAFFKFSRGAEVEADKLGVQYLYAAGYDPTAMSTMFEKLASRNKKKPNSLAKLFSTHPQSADRRDNSLGLVARFPEKQEYVISTSEFQRVKGRLMKMTNAKANVISDIDENGDAKPTLKRRQPASDDPNAPTTTDNNKKDDDKPQLKRRDAEPEPKPSPEK